MTGDIHPLASHHLPYFITAPGEFDRMMAVAAIGLIVVIVLAGVFYFHLHAIPERMGHGRANKVQFEMVAVLALLALFTHNNLFWVAALMLAMITVPDFQTPLDAMAGALTRMSGRRRKPEADETRPPEPAAPPVAEPAAPAIAPAAATEEK